jgi:hypothetical protein
MPAVESIQAAFCLASPGGPAVHQLGQWMLRHNAVPRESRYYVQDLSDSDGGLRYRGLVVQDSGDLTRFIDHLDG